MNADFEYQPFKAIQHSVVERNLFKVQKIPVFHKSKRENRKIMITSTSFFHNWYDLDSIYYVNSLCPIPHISPLEPLDNLICVSNQEKSIYQIFQILQFFLKNQQNLKNLVEKTVKDI